MTQEEYNKIRTHKRFDEFYDLFSNEIIEEGGSKNIVELGHNKKRIVIDKWFLIRRVGQRLNRITGRMYSSVYILPFIEFLCKDLFTSYELTIDNFIITCDAQNSYSNKYTYNRLFN